MDTKERKEFRQLVNKKGISQRRLATLANVSQSTVNRFLRGILSDGRTEAAAVRGVLGEIEIGQDACGSTGNETDKRRNIKRWMAESDISQADVARYARVNEGTVSKFMSGHANSRHVSRALESLGCPKDLLSDISFSYYICKWCKRRVRATRDFKREHNDLCTYCYREQQAARTRDACMHDPYEAGDLMTPPGVHVNDVIFCPFR